MNVTPSAIYITESQHVTNVLGVEILAMQETIRTQQATIDRLTEQRDRLWKIVAEKANVTPEYFKALIAEIEAKNGQSSN